MTSYSDFFTAAASAGGALTGLLFVALSVSPERLREISESLEHQAVAGTAFTALIDALFVSLAGLMPGGGTQIIAVLMGLIGLSSSAGLAWRLWQSRNDQQLTRRWPYLLGLIMVMYALQTILGATAGTAAASDSRSTTFIMIMFGIGIGRSWELLGLDGGGPLALLSRQFTRPDPGE